MKKILILLVGVLGLSCNDNEHHFYIQPELITYYDRFRDEARSRNINYPIDNAIVSISTQAMGYGGIGASRLAKDGQRYLYIDPIYWDKATEQQREVLFFHECGHTFLKRSHNGGWSIMNPKALPNGWPVCQELPTRIYCSKLLIDELFKSQFAL